MGLLTARLNRRVREWLDGTRSVAGNPFPMGLREWADLDLATRLDELAKLGEQTAGVGGDLVGFIPEDGYAMSSANVGDAIRELRQMVNGVSGGPVDASIVNYDNDDSGLTGENVQTALDELKDLVDTAQAAADAAQTTADDAATAAASATIDASSALNTANTATSNLAQLVLDLASTALNKGAALIGIHDTGAIITATTVEGALAEIQARVTTLISDLASTLVNKGASLIGINDVGGIITATTVEAALQEIQARITTALADFASTALNKGASLIGIQDAGNIITATTVEGAFAEIQARITTLISDLASTATNKGAKLIGIEDAGGIITATTVETALAEIQARITTHIADLIATTTGKGAALIGLIDAAGYYVATTVETALAEIRAEVVYTTPKLYPEGVGSAMYAGNVVYDYFDPPWDGAILHSVRAVPVDGLSTSAGGTLKMRIDKVAWDGSATVSTLLASGSDYNMTAGNSFVNKTPKVMTSASVLASSGSTRTIALGNSVRVGINSDQRSDLSGGLGWLITAGWIRA
jgi:hypothetical protein